MCHPSTQGPPSSLLGWGLDSTPLGQGGSITSWFLTSCLFLPTIPAPSRRRRPEKWKSGTHCLMTPPYTPPTPSRTSNTPPVLRTSSLWTVRPTPKPGGAAAPDGHPRPGQGAQAPLCQTVRRLPNKHPLTAMGGGDRPHFQHPCPLCCCDRVPALPFAHCSWGRASPAEGQPLPWHRNWGGCSAVSLYLALRRGCYRGCHWADVTAAGKGLEWGSESGRGAKGLQACSWLQGKASGLPGCPEPLCWAHRLSLEQVTS